MERCTKSNAFENQNRGVNLDMDCPEVPLLSHIVHSE